MNSELAKQRLTEIWAHTLYHWPQVNNDQTIERLKSLKTDIRAALRKLTLECKAIGCSEEVTKILEDGRDNLSNAMDRAIKEARGLAPEGYYV